MFQMGASNVLLIPVESFHYSFRRRTPSGFPTKANRSRDRDAKLRVSHRACCVIAARMREIAGLPKKNTFPVLKENLVYRSAAILAAPVDEVWSPMSAQKILVADDSRTIRALVRRPLAAIGYDVILASDGLEAVQLARRENPDLVILDIQMPEMDGYTACEEILALRELANVPIVFLTKVEAQHLHTLGNDLGAYLQKPVADELLLETVSQLLPKPDVATSPACSNEGTL